MGRQASRLLRSAPGNSAIRVSAVQVVHGGQRQVPGYTHSDGLLTNATDRDPDSALTVTLCTVAIHILGNRVAAMGGTAAPGSRCARTSVRNSDTERKSARA